MYLQQTESVPRSVQKRSLGGTILITAIYHI